MGTPSRYSQQVPKRCLRLIEELLPAVENVTMPEEGQGPLTTTFLLALATPIITYPIERIDRARSNTDAVYLNERPLDRSLTARVDQTLQRGKLGDADFYRRGHWRFAKISYDQDVDLMLRFPNDLAAELSGTSGMNAAESLPSFEWANCVRNALAHGGVLYLGKDGQHQHGEAAAHLGFVSATYPKYCVEEHPKGTPLYGRRDTSQRPEDLKVLRIAEEDFRSFLGLWVNWLDDTGFMAAMAA